MAVTFRCKSVWRPGALAVDPDEGTQKGAKTLQAPTRLPEAVNHRAANRARWDLGPLGPQQQPPQRAIGSTPLTTGATAPSSRSG